ncbi:MAG: UMP kinase [Nitrososphaeraceae archaeon]
MSKKRVVIKLSGSIFNLESTSIIKKYARMLIKIQNEVQPIIITGGGKIARNYINIARDLGYDESSLDLMGIDVSRLNAKLLISALTSYAYPKVPQTLEDVSKFSESNKIIISGGLHPGQSTNATSALIAEKVRAIKFINATDVNGIYDSDPRKNENAKLFKKIDLKTCLKILIKGSSMAGEYDLMDIVALKIIQRSHIDTRVILSTPQNIVNVVQSNSYIGTKIIF